MDISLLEKMKIIFESLFSSFMFIEIFLFFLLLFIIVVVNIKINNRIVPILFTIISMVGVLIFCIYFSSYVFACIDTFIMKIMDYYYFPSTVVFFFLFLIFLSIFIYTLFSKRLHTLKKIFNYCFSILAFLFFVMFIAFSLIHKIDLADTISLYRVQQILTVVQVSNLLFLVWVIITFFYHLYLSFKRKFDHKS